jgi:hypothetical protein
MDQQEQPPLFKTWRNLYAFVIAFLAIQVALYYFFTKAFQ